MPTIETYTPEQIQRLGQLGQFIETGHFDPNEYQKMRELGVEPKVYFDAVRNFYQQYKEGEIIEIPWPAEPSEVDSLYKEHVDFGCDGAIQVGTALVGFSEAMGAAFCPCCMVEKDPEGKIKDQTSVGGHFPDTGYRIKDLGSGVIVDTNWVGFHMATEHNSSAGLNIEKMVRILNLTPAEQEYPYA